MSRAISYVALAALLSMGAAHAAPVFWTDWTQASAGPSGSAQGTINTGNGNIAVSYAGEIAFAQTSGGTDYWIGSPSPYVSAAVDNAPGTPDIIALSSASAKTLTFSTAVDNLFFAVVSLNGNGYEFDEDFTIESYGCGYWGCGSATRQDMGNGKYRLIGSGELHGVIRFNRAVSSIGWTSLTNEYWNGFTIGTYGVAPPTHVPEPATLALVLAALGAAGAVLRRRG
jgi:hypothetical protein